MTTILTHRAPVLQEISKSTERSLYIPEESDWYSWPELAIVENKGFINIDTSDIDKTPVYVKGGAIIPLNVNEQETYLLISVENESSFIAYSDDGESNDYLNGEYEELKIDLYSDKVVFSGIKNSRMVSVELLKDGIKNIYTLELRPASTELLF